MSWPYLKAACEICQRYPLPTNEKVIIVALGDRAPFSGLVSASNLDLRIWTSLSEQSVRRSLRELMRRKIVSLRQAPSVYSKALWRLHYPGATQAAPTTQAGAANAAPGAKPGDPLLPEGQDYSPVLIPKSTGRRAAPPAPRTQFGARRQETPTPDQVAKLVHVLLDDDQVQIANEGDLEVLMKKACAQADFLYNTEVVVTGIRRALAARGIDPRNYRTQEIRRARRRAR